MGWYANAILLVTCDIAYRPTCLRHLTILASVVHEIWSGALKSREVITPISRTVLRLSFVGWDLLPPTHVPNCKCLRLPAAKMWTVSQNVKFVVIFVVRVTQGYRQCRHSIEHIHDFLIDFNRNNPSLFYRFRVIASYLSKVANFDLHLALPLGMTRFSFA